MKEMAKEMKESEIMKEIIMKIMKIMAIMKIAK
jgi:hypothetical protein